MVSATDRAAALRWFGRSADSAEELGEEGFRGFGEATMLAGIGLEAPCRLLSDHRK